MSGAHDLLATPTRQFATCGWEYEAESIAVVLLQHQYVAITDAANQTHIWRVNVSSGVANYPYAISVELVIFHLKSNIASMHSST